jgi:Flp pilus assembly protein CpaB
MAGIGVISDKRALTRRRALPSSRAVAGGLLIALAALATFSAYTGATARPTRSFVVAARDLPVGTRLARADLRLATIDLPAAQQRRAFRDAGALVGATVLGPVGRGELVQSSAVADEGDGSSQVSFSIEAARALDGAIRPGDRIDLLATYGGGGSDAYTMVVARRVAVADVSGSGAGSLGGARTLVLTLSLADPDTVLAVTHAARTGNLTVVRSGRAGGGSGSAGARVYRPKP